MNQIIDFFTGLFATELWPARWHCGDWSDFHGWLYIISDLMIWFAYFAIPFIIIQYIYKKKYELKYTKTYVLFASFILLCGSTHLLDASMFWVPMYRFSGLILFITGIVSLFTVYHLFRILPDAFVQKTSVVLEREIEKRVEAERKLSDANKGLQNFAYMASHDLQEPLRKVRMFTSRLKDENAEVLDTTSKELLQKTITAAERMHRIVQGILSLSTLTESVELGPTDLNAVVAEAKTDLEVKIHERSAVIEHGILPNVHGYHDYLVLLFVNLIGNAIKFSDKQPYVKIESERKGDAVILYVKDNGIGIGIEHRELIFETFQRLHGKDVYEGTGIGLSISKKIAEIHKGSISVESNVGEGSTFIIELQATKE